MNVSPYNTKDYENIANWTLGQNKPNSKPIQTQSNPILSAVGGLQMSVNIYCTEDYENKWLRRVRKNKPNTNPIQTQSKPVLSAVEWAKFRTLFPLTARPLEKKRYLLTGREIIMESSAKRHISRQRQLKGVGNE